MKFTESVRFFHTPATPGTSAWPPSLPSVPTSRATRVTSDANELSWSTIVFTVFFNSRISPFTSTVTFLDRKSTRLNSSHSQISYAVFCLKKKKNDEGYIAEQN